MGTKDESLARGFAELLRQLRLRAGMTLAELGAAVSPPMQAQAVARYETGTRVPTLALLYRLAAALKVDPKELLPAVNEPPAVEPAAPSTRKPKRGKK